MKELEQEVLVFPRTCVDEHDGFIRWTKARPLIRKAEKTARWLPRDKAERSREWVQAIPCAVIRGPKSTFCVLRRSRGAAANLRQRFSLIVGGHVDRTESPSKLSLASLFRRTLERELQEEVGLEQTVSSTPTGILIDASSISSSRHVAIVYEIKVTHALTARAPEEFSSRSKYSGQLFSARELARFRKKFDAWSLILFQQCIERSRVMDVGRQFDLSTVREDTI